MGVDGGSVFWELVGSIGATAAVGVPVSSVEGGGVTGAGTVLAASAWVLFCDGVRLGSVRAVGGVVCICEGVGSSGAMP